MLRRILLVSAFAAAVTPALAQTTPTTPAAPATPPATPPPLEPYEPTNALEQTFLAAYRSAPVRPRFRQQFLETNVLLVTVSNAPNAAPRLATAPGGEQTALIFTSGALLDARLGPDTPRLAMTGRAALQRVSETNVIINPGYAPMLALDPPGIAGFLDIPVTLNSAGPAQ